MSEQRWGRWIAGVVLACLLLWFVPLVRLESIDRANSAKSQSKFDARALAEQLWSVQLPQSFDQAHDATTVLEAIETNPAEARETVGRTVGVSRGFLVYLRGKAIIVDSERNRVTVSLTDDSQADIVLNGGPIFGNAVRDGAGLIESHQVANSQDFNLVSAELNRLVEERVLPPLKAGVKVGRSIQFIACAEVKDPERFQRPLEVVPVSIDLEQE